MKKIAFLALLLVATVIAEEESIEHMAQYFDSDVATIQTCMDEAETNIPEMMTLKTKWNKMQNDNLDEETKQIIMRHNRFLACMLEKKEMMQNSMLVLDKILELMDKEESEMMMGKDAMKECVNTLNDSSEMTREDRAMGLMVCMGGKYHMDEMNDTINDNRIPVIFDVPSVFRQNNNEMRVVKLSRVVHNGGTNFTEL